MRELPAVELFVTEQRAHASFVAPRPWVDVAVRTVRGDTIGWVGYGLSPIFDRVYVDGLHVEPEFRRQQLAPRARR